MFHSCRFPYKNSVYPSVLPYAYTSQTCRPPWFDRPANKLSSHLKLGLITENCNVACNNVERNNNNHVSREPNRLKLLHLPTKALLLNVWNLLHPLALSFIHSLNHIHIIYFINIALSINSLLISSPSFLPISLFNYSISTIKETIFLRTSITAQFPLFQLQNDHSEINKNTLLCCF